MQYASDYWQTSIGVILGGTGGSDPHVFGVRGRPPLHKYTKVRNFAWSPSHFRPKLCHWRRRSRNAQVIPDSCGLTSTEPSSHCPLLGSRTRPGTTFHLQGLQDPRQHRVCQTDDRRCSRVSSTFVVRSSGDA